jgi:hypothetical protein
MRLGNGPGGEHTDVMSSAGAAPSQWLGWSVVTWFVVGAAYGFGLLSILTIGLFVLGGAVIASGALLVTRAGRRGVSGVLCGPAIPLLYVAFLNRGGPGHVCTTVGDATGCIEMWSPWPWVVAALAFLIAGSVLVRRQQHRASTASL